ncbi:MAG: hypothetical protein Q8Q09_14245 [Deltaproteobacteria bacterium]|nr:hypothetical protein [Deltaproteobacteria bacterium]
MKTTIVSRVFALGLASVSVAIISCQGMPQDVPCVRVIVVGGANRTPVINPTLAVVSGPDQGQVGYAYETSRILMHAMCRGTNVIELSHPDHLPTRLTYTSPRDRDPLSNDFTDVITVTLTPR